MQNTNEIKDQICDVCHKMWQLGWVAANDGNVSVRLEDGRILATPHRYEQILYYPGKAGACWIRRAMCWKPQMACAPPAKSKCTYAATTSGTM